MRGTFAFGALICGLAALVGSPVRPASGDVAPAQSGEVLGFDLDEVRHYQLGPPEALAPGEASSWSIKLTDVRGTGGGMRATFELSHERAAPRVLASSWSSGQVTHAKVDATLVVNAYGAPLELSYDAQRHIYDVGDESFVVEYRYEGNKYQKKVTLQGVDWDFDIALIERPNLNPSVPIGLFAFAPGAVDCFEWQAGIVIEQRVGTGDVAPATVSSADRRADGTVEGMALAGGSCFESNTDPAFANPGLASMAMPLLWEQRGDSELVLFSPLRPDLVRGQGNGIPLTLSPIIPTVPGVPGSSILSGAIPIPGLDIGRLIGGGGTDGDKEYARNPARYFFPRRLQLSERQRIDVGRRKMEAMPLQVAGFAGTVWVDDWGKVVRMDVPALRVGDPERWVRLLHESEY